VVAAALVYAAVATKVERRAIAAQTPPVAAEPAAEARVDRSALMGVVRTLSSPAFGGRRTGTPGGIAARRFIQNAFQQLGLAAGAPSFLQPFSFVHTSVGGLVRPGRAWKTPYDDAANVLGIQPGTQGASRAIVISAHYDHVGTRDGAMYPGADDNASGVAALLAVARYVHAHPLRHRTVFAAFDAEELGLQGAQAFLRAPPVPAGSIALDINFDMVSRNDRNEIFAAGTYHYPSLRPIIDDVQRRTPVKILFGHDRPMTRAGMVDDWTMQSDHGVFHARGIPFLYFGVEDHPDYHQPSDTADKIDSAFFGNVVEMLLDVVLTADKMID
jgi:Zn-dependent M28 family amino/carboxypeptidase